MEPRPGPVPESQTVASFVVYRRSDGVILHTHHVMVLPGAEEPRAEAMAAEAVELAGSVAGAEESDVDVLQVDAAELRPGASYAVDVQERRLLVVPEAGPDGIPGRAGRREAPEEE
jgi:S1-C subfamily serine protease